MTVWIENHGRHTYQIRFGRRYDHHDVQRRRAFDMGGAQAERGHAAT